MNASVILAAADEPERLEQIYRDAPTDFRAALPEAFAAKPDSLVLRAWHARLTLEETEAAAPARWDRKALLAAIALSLIAGTLVKLPDIIPGVPVDWFGPRAVPGIVMLVLAGYFIVENARRDAASLIAAGAILAGIVYLLFLPGARDSHSLILAWIHMIVVYAALVGVVYCGAGWRETTFRMTYIRFMGDAAVYATVVLIGGMVMTALTLALFGAMGVHIEEWYFENVVVYGLVGVPVFGVFLRDTLMRGRIQIAPVLARIFTPLFLLTVLAFTVAMGIIGKSPFLDRDFLIVLNGLLCIVVGLSIFSIVARGGGERFSFADAMTLGLVLATLCIDVVALGAIVFRLSSFGLTPNRLAVLGGNIVMCVNLLGLAYLYFSCRHGRRPYAALETWIARYLPVYVVWCLFVSVVFPLVFD